MSSSPQRVEWITLFVEDLETARAFYREVFGLAVIFEDADSVALRMENINLNLLKVPAARDLIEPGVVAEPDSGSRVQYTIPVPDVDAMCAQLSARGVTLLNGPMDRPWGVRTASFTDPAGHLWEIAHDIPLPG